MHRGSLVAAALHGAWRSMPAPSALDADGLSEVTPLLLATGAGGLAWRQIQTTNVSQCRPAMKLRQAYRLHTLQAAIHDRQLVAVIRLLRSAGVEPLLGKGWAAARLYPEPGLRPYGDHDLCVRPEQFATAQEVLREAAASSFPVELHRGLIAHPDGEAFSLLDDHHIEELYERSQLITLDGTPIRILGPEDHLRLLCLHMLNHGAWRPLWLCDIGAALEGRPSDFDWDLCLSGDRRRSDWVACCLALAQRLLGARLDGSPAAVRSWHMPCWLGPAVLRQWGYLPAPRAPISNCLRRPLMMLKELRHHWPNGVEATVVVRGSFSELPRLPFQLGAIAVMTAKFLSGLTRQVRY